MKKLLIFDFDGVLEDTFDWNFEVAKSRYGDITREEYRSWFNGNIYEHPTVLEAGPMNVAEYFEKYREGFAGKELGGEFKAFFEEISGKFRLAIISSIDEDIINPYLERSKVKHLFGEVWGHNTEKSKITKFRNLLDKYDLDISECLFITDTLGDIFEASGVGIPVVGVTWGYHDEETLKKGNPRDIVKSIAELKEFLVSF